jgi:gamma-glutamylcyclotransferase (GGCT)/AIG2-like uncharacterized protein YtfP
MENNKLFCYGILQRGHELDLTQASLGGKFLGEALIQGANLYRIGSGVGLRLVEDPHKVAHGELFEIPDTLWPWLDDIEQNGFCYTRKIVEVHMDNARGLEAEELLLYPVKAWVYVHSYPNFEYKNLIEGGRF